MAETFPLALIEVRGGLLLPLEKMTPPTDIAAKKLLEVEAIVEVMTVTGNDDVHMLQLRIEEGVKVVAGRLARVVMTAAYHQYRADVHRESQRDGARLHEATPHVVAATAAVVQNTSYTVLFDALVHGRVVRTANLCGVNQWM